MSGRILNFDKVITETVTVAVNGGPTWRLRDDIPAGALAVAFHVFDLERQMGPAPEGAEPRTVEEESRLLEAHQEALLDAVTVIVQHSCPEVTRDEVAEALSPSARGQVLQVFFPLLLRRYGGPSQRSEQPSERQSETPTAPGAKNRAQRRSAATADGMRSRKR